MKIFLPLLFALIAAIGNAMFALGQKRSSGAENGLAFVAASALIATALAWCVAPMLGRVGLPTLLRLHAGNLLLAGSGLFLTYLGFNLLYSHFGVSPYILYAVLSILTTTVFIGILWLKEPVNGCRIASIVLALASVALYSLSQSPTR